MIKFNKYKKYLVLGAVPLIVLLSFQNCGAPKSLQHGSSVDESNLDTDAPATDIDPASAALAKATIEMLKTSGELLPKSTSCNFGASVITEGDSIIAYQNSSVASGQTCAKEFRICSNGTLSGTYRFDACVANGSKSCLFNGITIPHGKTTTAYKEVTAGSAKSCASQTLTCDNGNLPESDYYPLAACDPKRTKDSCLFNGEQYAHGEQFNGYQFDDNLRCQKLEMVCNNGIVPGANTFSKSSCRGGDRRSCFLATANQEIPDGEAVRVFKTNSVASGTCSSSEITCVNGKFNGEYKSRWLTCRVGAASVPRDVATKEDPKNTYKSCDFNGEVKKHGVLWNAYSKETVTSPETCEQVKGGISCNDGKIAAASVYKYSSCKVTEPKKCAYNGATKNHGESWTVYSKDTADVGTTCESLSGKITCTDGVLSGSTNLKSNSCKVATAKSCTLDGVKVEHGKTVMSYYEKAIAYNGTCKEVLNTCSDGKFTVPNYLYSSCTKAIAKSCTFNGKSYAHAENIQAYYKDSVPYNQKCTDYLTQLKCDNGSVLGADRFPHASCKVETAKSCTFDGKTYAHESKVKMYMRSGSGATFSCSSIEDTCRDGVLTLALHYPYSSCVSSSGASCTVDGVTVAHGGTIKAYTSKTPYAAGQACTGFDRLCNNGSLTGMEQYKFSSCSSAPVNCTTTDGVSIPHGTTKLFYYASKADSSGYCRGATNTCTFGNIGVGNASTTYQYCVGYGGTSPAPAVGGSSSGGSSSGGSTSGGTNSGDSKVGGKSPTYSGSSSGSSSSSTGSSIGGSSSGGSTSGGSSGGSTSGGNSSGTTNGGPDFGTGMSGSFR